MSTADLTIIVPTYNERERLAELVRVLFTAATQHQISLEVVVVDDNSPDGTGALADDLALTNPMKVLHRKRKLGLGTAVVEGFDVAGAETVGVMDADLSHPPLLVPLMLAVFTATQADLLVASRYVQGGSTSDWPLRRRLLSRVACLLASGLTSIRDSTSGFFLVRRRIALGALVRAGGFKICLELLVRGEPARIVEIPYRFVNRETGTSKMNSREAAAYLLQIKDLYLFKLRNRRPAPTYRRLPSDELDAFSEPAPRSGNMAVD